MQSTTPQQRALEMVWTAAFDQLCHGSSEIVLTAQDGRVLGQQGIKIIAERFSVFIRGRASVLHDPSIDAIRILPPPQQSLIDFSGAGERLDMLQSPSPELSSESGIASSPPAQCLAANPARKIAASLKSKIAKERISKVPRPPNAFILYRQFHHPLVKEKNPGLHNNEISVIIGKQWKNEEDAVKSTYKRKAEEVKRKHAEQHPEYQYQPRKPSERKKRATKTKSTKMSLSPSRSPPLAPFSQEQYGNEPAHVHENYTFQPVDEGTGLLHDFSMHDHDTFSNLIAQHNSTSSHLVGGLQNYISPQVLMTGPSIKSANQYAVATSSVDYPVLDAQAQELHDRLMAELDASSSVVGTSNNPPAVTGCAPTTNIGLGIDPALLNTESSYNVAWKENAAREDMRMGNLQMVFGDGLPELPEYANGFGNDHFAFEPIIGSDGLEGELLPCGARLEGTE